MFIAKEIIREKREKQKLTKEEIDFFVKGIVSGDVTDAQIASLAMAIFFNGLSLEECIDLTKSMRDSGDVLTWNLGKPVVDKHSTGGVGDLTSLVLGPLVASCGAIVPMIAGRGLGHTGGTLDKFDSLLGYNTSPDLETFKKVIKEVGVAIIGQTANLAPADKRFYAVRDTTATVESIGLITASILSKKLSEGLDSLVMDVKTGNGAFMETYELSMQLANSISSVATGAGVKTSALITDMNQPLGSNVGNSLEMIEAIKYLQGSNGNLRLKEVIDNLAIKMLIDTNIAASCEEAQSKIDEELQSGRAFEVFSKMCHALGTKANAVEDYKNNLPEASMKIELKAEDTGVIESMDCRNVGMALVALGGGRMKVTDKIDYSVGFSDFIQIGQKVNKGDVLTIIHANDSDKATIAKKMLLHSIKIGSSYTKNPVIYKIIN